MSTVDIAERQSRLRAFGLLFLAALTCAVMVAVRAGWNQDFAQGLWFGVLFGCMLNLLPIKRWLRPNSDVLRLVDDEGALEHRRLSCTVGFWAGMAVAIFLGMTAHFLPEFTGEAVAQFVATTGIVSAMIAFAVLELRAAR